jgi:HSP20 family protein
MEFNYMEFKRSFTVPENVNPELIKAKYEDGILKILLPKLEVEKRLPKKEIKIM